MQLCKSAGILPGARAVEEQGRNVARFYFAENGFLRLSR